MRVRLLAIRTRGDVQTYVALGLSLKCAGFGVSIAAMVIIGLVLSVYLTAGCADVDPRMSCMHNRLIRLFGGTVCMRHAIRVNHIEIRCQHKGGHPRTMAQRVDLRVA